MSTSRFNRSASSGPGGSTQPEGYVDGAQAPLEGASGSPSITLGFVYFVLFRHKWKIAICTLVGFVAALAFFLLNPPPFISQAKVLIKYVEEKTDSILEDGTKVKSPDMRGETIIKTEVEILTSFDLAQEVVRTMGAERVLPGNSANASPDSAAIAIYNGLVVTPTPRSSVLDISFSGRNPETIQPVLTQIVQTYLKRHAEAHRSSGVRDDALTQETDQLRAKLGDTEEELRKLMERAGVISLEEAKRVFGEQIARLQENIMNAETELAGSKATLSAMTGAAIPTDSPAENDSAPATVPPETVNAYRQAVSQLDTLYRREQELLLQFTAETPMVKGVRGQILENESLKSRLERDYPGLISSAPVTRTAIAPGQMGAVFDAAAEAAKIRSIESRINVMKNQLATVRNEINSLGGLETAITELQRRRELLSKQYNYFSENLEKKRIDVTLGSVSNISVIQTPSPPRKDSSQLTKIMAGLCAGGLAFGLGLAFVMEMFLDQSVKRAVEIESTFGLPLVLTIPRMKRDRAALKGGSVPLLGTGDRSQKAGAKGQGSEADSPSSSSGALTPWSANHELRTFFDALRNRLIYNFEMRGITRKPKLVAVTSCGADSGVSTIAAGLAASLSETGDGNVLLVDMNPDRKTPQYFHKGDLKVGLDDVLAQETRDDAMVRENLYMVSQQTAEDRLSWIMPKKFAQLVPKMKASDFDYIIFDMPPVSQISATPQLARFMDQVLMVVESEKTSRDSVKRAGAMLAEAGANVGVILNKTQSYVPLALDQDARAS